MKNSTNNNHSWTIFLTVFGVLAWTSFPFFNYFTAQANSLSGQEISVSATPTPKMKPKESPMEPTDPADPADPKASPSPTASPTPFPSPSNSPTPFPSVSPMKMPSPSPTMQP